MMVTNDRTDYEQRTSHGVDPHSGELAPLNGTRVIPAKVYADCLLDLLVNVADMKPPSPDDVDALVAMFRAKLEAMIEAKAGHTRLCNRTCHNDRSPTQASTNAPCADFARGGVGFYDVQKAGEPMLL